MLAAVDRARPGASRPDRRGIDEAVQANGSTSVISRPSSCQRATTLPSNLPQSAIGNHLGFCGLAQVLADRKRAATPAPARTESSQTTCTLTASRSIEILVLPAIGGPTGNGSHESVRPLAATSPCRARGDRRPRDRRCRYEQPRILPTKPPDPRQRDPAPSDSLFRRAERCALTARQPHLFPGRLHRLPCQARPKSSPAIWTRHPGEVGELAGAGESQHGRVPRVARHLPRRAIDRLPAASAKARFRDARIDVHAAGSPAGPS